VDKLFQYILEVASPWLNPNDENNPNKSTGKSFIINLSILYFPLL
jgi:hypothetical protein